MATRLKLQDIAKQVGVTKMTISRYFNDPESVAEKTRQKIAAIIEEQGFIPNRVPAIMSQSSSKSIGLVIPSFSNLVFADVIDAVENTAESYGYSVLLMHSSYDIDKEEKKIADLLSYQVDAVILTESEHSSLTIRRLKKSGLPVAEIMSVPDDPIDIAYGINHTMVTRQVTQALIDCGRVNIAYFGVRMDRRTLERQRGYEMAMRENGLAVNILDSSAHSNFSIGHELMNKALEDRKPDAILCTNDDVAIGAVMACHKKGIRIPEDITILGYNGLSVCDAASPRLCSIKTPRYEMGRTAVEKIMRQLQSGVFDKTVQYAHCSLTTGGTATETEQRAINTILNTAIRQE